MNARQLVTFPIWWPMMLAGNIVALVGKLIVYLGCCIHDGMLPSLKDLRP